MQGSTGTKARIVEAAMGLFWEHGYERTGIADITAAAGVRSGSLYHFFATKEDVLTAVLERYLEGLTPQVMAPAFASTADPVERVFAVLDGYRARILATEFRYRCPVGSLALEMQNASERARELVRQNFAGWRAAIAQCVRDAAPALRDGVDADSLATFVLTVMEGGVMQAAAERDIARYDDSVHHLRTYLHMLERIER
ncbi:MAG TPA: TetR/AcrR family transcriptional regulator [Dongiaceae bacterium]|nr:TetR/AcrR family transcriptional regulator [Dongiaceae bacterium]